MMEIYLLNEKGNYEFTQEQYNELIDCIFNIENYAKLSQIYCEHHLCNADLMPLLLVSEKIQAETKIISNKF